MRKALGILAVLGLVAAPAMADLSSGLLTSPMQANLAPIPAGHGSVGPWRLIQYSYAIHTSASGYNYYQFTTYGIYGQSQIVANRSDIVTVTFAFHWPFTENVIGRQLWTSLQWDNSEVEVLSVTPVGIFGGSNIYTTQHTIVVTTPIGYSAHTSLSGSTFVTTGTTVLTSFLFPDPFWGGNSSGTITVGDVLGTELTSYPLWQNPTGITTFVGGSSFFPFMQVRMHVKDPDFLDGAPDIIIKSAALLFYRFGFSGLWFTGGGLGQTSWGEDIIPEPASLSLLGVGMVAIGAGVWRRRRR
jgi:hypothetical protein